MKKFKSLFLVAAAVLISFSSCNNDEVEPNNIHDGNVRLQLVMPATTLAVGPAQTDAAVAITSGTVIFTTSTGVIQHVHTIHPAGTGGGVLTMSDLAGGHVFSNVSALATQVHFVGNTTIAATLVPGVTNISSVLNQVLPITSQAGNLEGTHQVVNVYRMGTIASNNTVSIDVEPTVGRVEIHRITGDYTIAGFTVHGIFMDRYFQTAHLDGRLIGEGATDNPLIRSTGNVADVPLFNFPSVGTNAFTTTMRGPIFDWSDSGSDWIGGNIGTALTMNDHTGAPLTGQFLQSTRPGGSNVWGYNLFANYTHTDRSLGSQFPLIILRMSDVTIRQEVRNAGTGVLIGHEIVPHPEHEVVAGTPTHPYLFITIRGFTPAGGTPLNVDTGFLPRRVYQIGTDETGWFGRDALRRVPNEQPINVTVTVTPMAWLPIPGRPVI